MVKRANLLAIITLAILMGLSAPTHAQVNTSPKASSNNGKQLSFFINWGGKRLGAIAQTNGKGQDKAAGGVIIKDVIKNTAADRAGLLTGDIITQINGNNTKSPAKLRNVIEGLDYGTEYKMEITRNSAAMELKFTLVQGDDDEAYYSYYEDQATQALQDLQNQLKKNGAGNGPIRTPKSGFANENAHNHLGARVQELNDQLKAYFAVSGGGILVTAVNASSAAETAGFKAGDCITEIDGIAINSIHAFNKELKKNTSGQFNFTIIRDRQEMMLQATIDTSK